MTYRQKSLPHGRSGAPALALALLVIACGGQAAKEGAPPAPTTAPPTTTPPTPGCDPSSATDIEVSGADRDGFPPYAVASCMLAYVNRDGDLVARDLVTRSETRLAPASEHPRRPAASPDLVAWEADEGGHSVVRVRAGGGTRTVSGTFAASGEPRASGSSVVFTAWQGGPETPTDVWVYDATTGNSTLVIGGPGQQRFADITSRYIAATDFSEDPDGRFDDNETDIADVVVLDRASGVLTARRRPGKQAFPMLGDDDALAYLDWASIHPEPKLVAYELRGGRIAQDPAADRALATVYYASSTYARPALAGGTLEWVANPDGRTTLWRTALDGSTPPAAVGGLDDLRLYAPAATASGTERGFTVLAASRSGASGSLPRLRAVTR